MWAQELREVRKMVADDVASQMTDVKSELMHLRQLILSLMILKFPLVHKVHSLRHAYLNLMSRQIRLAYRQDYHQDGLQLHHLLVVEKSGNRKYTA